MDHSTKVISIITNFTGKASTVGQINVHTKGNGSITIKMDMDN